MKLKTLLKKWFIADLNYNIDEQHLMVRGFNKTNGKLMRHNPLDLKEFDAFVAGKANMKGRPLNDKDIDYIENEQA